MARSSPTRTALAVLLPVLVAGCRDPNLRPALPPDVRVDTYTQQSASMVDVLWVVDNSESMAPRQENLAKNFQAFIQLFSQSAIDYRIAVTTTDIFKDQGQFRGSPKVISPSTPNPATAFANNIRVGITGSPFEAGLEAAQMALEKQAMANAGKATVDFLRSDAYLYLIFVSDEEDRSPLDVRYYWRSFETAKGVGNDGTVTTAAIMGDVPRNSCGATPGTRYDLLSKLTGGEVGSICDADFANTLRKLATSAVGLKRKFTVTQPPNVETISVMLRYPCGATDEQLKACASVDRTRCGGVSPEALALECTPKQGETDGWTYEPGNRLIAFSGDAVPGIGAEVDIQYYQEGKGP
ncbi:MAG: vWA domain-containing protein [Myxococcaceae bacterium]